VKAAPVGALVNEAEEGRAVRRVYSCLRGLCRRYTFFSGGVFPSSAYVRHGPVRCEDLRERVRPASALHRDLLAGIRITASYRAR
jgi:hypothetical protein